MALYYTRKKEVVKKKYFYAEKMLSIFRVYTRMNADKHSPASSARSTKRRVRGADMEVIRDFEVTGILGEDQVETDGSGYVKAGEDCVTNLPGVFAAGDLRTKSVKQIITAVADGADAINSAQDYLTENA